MDFQPIETAPKVKGKFLLGYSPKWEICMMHWSGEKGLVDDGDTIKEVPIKPKWILHSFMGFQESNCLEEPYIEAQPTHWMKIPRPPNV